ncbi:hypothetical protein SAMN05444673_3065 [Bacillus sp. OV166]|nr:hypothetical protein SAMN05444673_3065 [Bacillus sp. OV166]
MLFLMEMQKHYRFSKIGRAKVRMTGIEKMRKWGNLNEY